jgi:transcriptional regulator with XRE-family HTH domain
METGKLIKELRIKKGLTQEELAEKTEVSARTIQRIENGEVDPRAYTLQMIAKALDVDFSILIENESDESKEIQRFANNNWLGLLHLSGIIPILLPTIVMWNMKKNKTQDINEHYRSVISFQLMIFGIILGSLWIYWKVGQPLPLIGVLLMNGLFSLVNTVKVMSGDSYLKTPFIKNGGKELKNK